MRTIFESSERVLIAAAINSIGRPIDITKYRGRLRFVQLTLAEPWKTSNVLQTVIPPVFPDEVLP